MIRLEIAAWEELGRLWQAADLSLLDRLDAMRVAVSYGSTHSVKLQLKAATAINWRRELIQEYRRVAVRRDLRFLANVRDDRL